MPKVKYTGAKGLVQKTGRGFEVEEKVTVMGGIGGLSLQTISAEITVVDGDTTAKSSGLIMPLGFVALVTHVRVTTASTNNVNLDTIGTDATIAGFNTGDNIISDLRTGGADGVMLACNGTLSLATANSAGVAATDELEVDISGDPGATGVTMVVTIFGIAP